MPATLSKVYPYFERGFPLRSGDLNNLVSYFETEDRQTRFWLIGAGCLHGLTPEFIDKGSGKYQLRIKKGAGVTSLGYALIIEEDTEFGKIQKTDLTTHDFLDSAAVVAFEKMTGLPPEQILVDAKELFPDNTGPGIDATEFVPASGKYNIVLLYNLKGNRSEQGCQNCEKSILATSDIRVLLLSDNDLAKIDDIIRRLDNNCLTGNESQFQDSGYPYIERFDATGVENHEGFVGRYFLATQNAPDRIKGYLDTLQNHPLIKKLFPISIPTEKLSNLYTRFTDFKYSFQYINTYLRDLIKAYEEFAETPVGESINFLPAQNCFPRHLILGSIPQVSNPVSTEGRTPFYRPPFGGMSDIDLEKAAFLYNRLIVMLNKFILADYLADNPPAGNLEDVFLEKTPVSGIQITPSMLINAPLSQQAIPYYYYVDYSSDNIRTNWNFYLNRTNRWKSIPGYIRYNEEPHNEPLLYQPAFDKADFYRIEGHIRKSLAELGAVTLDTDGDLVDSTFHSLRKSLNLPFAIKLCTLEPATLNGRPIPLFSTFINQHPGLEHQGGVPKGGTFVLVIDGDTNKFIVGDFCLPYYVCCKKEAVIAEFMVESPNNFVQSYEGDREVYEFPVRYSGDQGELNIYFKNLSENAESYWWKVLKEGAVLFETADTDLAFKYEFLISGDSTQYELNLTARRDNQDVASVTKKIILKRETEVSVIAEFVVENPNDFEQGRGHTSDGQGNPINVEMYTFPVEAPSEGDAKLQVHFKNISQHADRYFWTVWKEGDNPGNRVEDFDLALDHPFVLEGAQTAYLVRLTASRENAPEVSVVKKIVLRRVVVAEESPVIAEFIVESPNDFEQGRGQTSDDQGNSINVEMYTFPVEAPAEGDFKLQVHFKNISQHADRYFWTVWKEGDVPGNRVEDFDLALDRPFLLEGAQTAYLVRLTALREDASEVSIVKKIVLRREVEEQPPVADFAFLSAESKKVESVDTSDPAKVMIRLKKTISPLQNLVVNWVNKSPKNTESYLWKALQKSVRNPFDISTAKKNFKSTLPVNPAQKSEFTITLRATNTATGLSDEKSIIVEVHPSD